MSDHGANSTVPLPDVIEEAVTLETRPTLGLAQRVERRLNDRASIGWPAAARLHPDEPNLSAEMRAELVRSAPEHAFYLVDMRCSFRPDGFVFEEATFSVAVERADNAREAVPLIWSMTPLRLATPVRVRSSRTIAPTLTLIPDVAELGLGTEREESYEREDVYLCATREREPTAEWTFRQLKNVEIIGTHQLTMIIRCPADAVTRVSSGLSTKARVDLGRVIPYRAVSNAGKAPELLLDPAAESGRRQST